MARAWKGTEADQRGDLEGVMARCDVARQSVERNNICEETHGSRLRFPTRTKHATRWFTEGEWVSALLVRRRCRHVIGSCVGRRASKTNAVLFCVYFSVRLEEHCQLKRQVHVYQQCYDNWWRDSQYINCWLYQHSPPIQHHTHFCLLWFKKTKKMDGGIVTCKHGA